MTEAVITRSLIDPEASHWKRLLGLDRVHQQTVISHPGDPNVVNDFHEIYGLGALLLTRLVRIEHPARDRGDIVVTFFDLSGKSTKQELVQPGARVKFTHPNIGEIEIQHTPLQKG